MYFGYFHLATSIEEHGEHIEEVSQWTNLNHIAGYPTTHLEKMSNTKSKALVDVRWQFFDAHFNLHAQFEQNWTHLKHHIKPYMDTIVGFYIDEPYHGMETRAGADDALKYKNLAIVANYLKNDPDVKDKKLLIVFAYPQIKPTMQVPSSVDWVGLDKYSVDFSEIVQLNQTLKSCTIAKNPHQKMFLVPQSYVARDTDTDQQQAQWMQQYYDYAKSDPDIIGMMMFLYSWKNQKVYDKNYNYLYTLPDVGAKALPLTLKKQQEIGQEIINGPPKTPTPPDQPNKPVNLMISDNWLAVKFTPPTNTGSSNIQQYIIFVNQNAFISTKPELGIPLAGKDAHGKDYSFVKNQPLWIGTFVQNQNTTNQYSEFKMLGCVYV